MPKSSNTITTAADMLKRILHLLEESQERSTLGNGTSNECRTYTNKELMKLLGVESRYLKEVRYWVRKVNSLETDGPFYMKKLVAQIPAFLHFLMQRELSVQCENRMWFSPE